LYSALTRARLARLRTARSQAKIASRKKLLARGESAFVPALQVSIAAKENRFHYDANASGDSLYNYFRDYDPSLARYLESDRIGLMAGTNTYGYVAANPYLYFDPKGQLGQAAAGCLLGAWGGVPGCAIGASLATVGTVALAGIMASAIGSDSSSDVVRDQRPFYPGRRECDGTCNPCPPTVKWDADGDAHGSTGGRHWHGIQWDQNPQTCWCYPKRLSGPTPYDLK